jgi:type IV secretory pathway TraG/TraD family ATPase VirD4
MILGTDYVSTNEPLRLSTDALRRHLYIVGKSGTGKSVLLDNLITDLIENGSGCCLIDPHGDLAEAVASRVPQKRINDVIYFDPADLSYSLGYDPLACTATDNRPLVAENVLSAFAHVWGLSAQHTPRLLHILRNALRLLLDNQETLLGLPRLLTNDRYRTRLLKRCEDATVLMFWEDEFGRWNDRQRSEYLASLQNKLGALMSNPTMRNTLSHSTLDLATAMNQGQVLVCNLAKGRLGEETSNLLGALLATGFAQAAHGRAAIPEDERRDFTIFIDEFQNFTTSSFADMLSEARKYRLSLVVAHQFLSQVPESLQDAVIGTANTTIVFRCGANDAPLLASELDLDQPRELKNVPNYRAIVRTLQDGFPGNVHRIQTVPPRPIGKRLAAVRKRTRARYARPRAMVEASMQRMMAG